MAFCRNSFLLLSVLFCSSSSSNIDIWFGTSPFCASSQNDCKVFGFNYIKEDSTGDGKKCLTGKKVLCRVPISIPKRNEDVNTLKVAAYNVYDRPFIISHDGQRERLCRIPAALFKHTPDLDVIIFSEVFVGTCWDSLDFRRLLSAHEFAYMTKTVGTYFIKLTNGGVLLASRWPIEKENTYVFKATHGSEADQFSSKGVVYARINKLGQIYHVAGTHLQAQNGVGRDEVREKQAREMYSFIASQMADSRESKPLRLIMGGDFNCDRLQNKAHTERVLSNLDGAMPSISPNSAPATMMTKENNVADPQDIDEWLDYIIYSNNKNHAKVLSSTIESVRLKVAELFAYCASAPLQPVYVWPDALLCKSRRITQHLSDHYPVFATFQY